MRPIKRTEDDNKLKGLNIIIPITKKVEIKRIIKLVESRWEVNNESGRPEKGYRTFYNAFQISTSLTFDENGRYSNNYRDLTKKSIVVLGDSHAMGWGVNDNETFSYLLESKINRPVYNLSISGFGTVRQLIRLQNSKLLDDTDADRLNQIKVLQFSSLTINIDDISNFS